MSFLNDLNLLNIMEFQGSGQDEKHSVCQSDEVVLLTSSSFFAFQVEVRKQKHQPHDLLQPTLYLLLCEQTTPPAG